MGVPTTTTDNTLTSLKTSRKQTTSHRIALGDVTQNNMGQLKRLNSVLFPVHYTDRFYKDVLEVGEFAKLAYFNDACVGGVCCRKELIAGTPEKSKLYIMTLGVLAPYRNLGLGTALLKHILEHAHSINSSPTPQNHPKFTEVYLHVQTSNNEAISFYKKYDFEIVGTIQDYYKKITPPDAYILSKKLLVE
ncbi:14237_t:CDS:2 [Ambispora leptoticha]|uniref:14237_t:CDS:1 n=1 Tax=Ambispora leptoticha TaxID=144679 RepID=A0A9N9AHW1_9GLOM|nr:14237_t:CDS:2 [Ambispora leptoticha]